MVIIVQLLACDQHAPGHDVGGRGGHFETSIPDAVAEPNVRIVAAFPEDSHAPIIYPAALTKDSKNADAKAFLDFLRSAKARTAFEKQGFTVLVKSATGT